MKKDILINNLNKLRTQKGITQEDLAESVGVTRQTIIAIEKGRYLPSIVLALKLSTFFKVALEDIFKLK